MKGGENSFRFRRSSRGSIMTDPNAEMGKSWTPEAKQGYVINQIAEQTGKPVISRVINQLNGSSNPAEMDILKAFEIQEKISKKLEKDIADLSKKKKFLLFKNDHVMTHLYLMNKSLAALIKSREEVNKKGSSIKLVVNKISGGIQQYDDYLTSMINFIQDKIVNQLPSWDDYEEVLKQTSLEPKYYYSELGLLAYLTKKHGFTSLTTFTPYELRYLSEDSVEQYKKRKMEELSLSNTATIQSGIIGNIKLNDPSGTGGRRTRRRRNKRRTHKKRN